MAEQTAYMADFRSQFQNFYQNLTFGKKLFLILSLLSIIVGISVFVYFSQQKTWSLLVKDISPKEAAEITQRLEEKQVPYILQPGGNGILVPVDQVDKTRLDIASSGLLMGGVVGLEIFDKTNLAATEFQQKVQYKRAIEGELSRLITQIDVIKAAKISLAIPEKSLFLEEEKKPTASIVVDTKGRKKLSPKGVETIVNLVAGSVSGMQVEDVRVSDSQGNLLSKGKRLLDATDSRDKNYLYQHAIEEKLQLKLLSQLEKITGKGRVEVRVSARINFDTNEIVEDLVDPDGSALLSEETTSEKSTGSRSIPVGIPGATSNSPEVRAGASEVANVSDVNRKTKRSNYVNSRRHVVTKKVSGNIERLSVAVLVDGKYDYVRDDSGELVDDPAYKERSPQELEKIMQIAKVAVGFDSTRGDTIEVKNLRFDEPMLEHERLKREAKEASRNFIIKLTKFFVVGVVLIVLIFMVIRPMVQKLAAKPEDLDLLMGLPTTIGELQGEELEIPTEKEAGLPPRDKILEIARQDPLKTASLVRTWLRDKRDKK